MSAISDLIFPELATNFNHTLNDLKKANLSIKNRLRSITDDADFVCAVSEVYALPLVANERCGSWYIPTERKAASVYFKSTDGHMGQWSFSLRRLNLQLLDILAQVGGCIIVDSTRRGKSMPDALSKSVPIWCAVLNRVLFPGSLHHHQLHTPPNSVSRSEHSGIEQRLDKFVQDFVNLGLGVSSICSTLRKPLQPIWITRDSVLPHEPPRFDDCCPVVLCTASRRVVGAEHAEAGYIQGAGDDSETWAYGLTPPVFWQHKVALLDSADELLPSTISRLLVEHDKSRHIDSHNFLPVKPATKLVIGPMRGLVHLALSKNDLVISSSLEPDVTIQKQLKSRYLHLKCRANKLGSRDLRTHVIKIPAFIEQQQSINRIYVACESGADLSVGVALALLCLYYSTSGILQRSQESRGSISKAYIKQRLSWIMSTMPHVSPSRTTLQTVNSFLFTCKNP